MKTNTSKFDHAGDNLIYVVLALPGGQDGMDSSNKGGPVRAFRKLEEAKEWAGVDSRYKIDPKVMGAPTVRRALKNKLSVVEKFYLEILGVDLAARDGRAR